MRLSNGCSNGPCPSTYSGPDGENLCREFSDIMTELIKSLRVVGGKCRRTGTRYNILEAKIEGSVGFRWVEIDREEVPSFVIIDLGCFGDTGGWLSKYTDMKPYFVPRKKYYESGFLVNDPIHGAGRISQALASEKIIEKVD